MGKVTVSALFVYPIKSARGVALPSAVAADRGFEHDRRFMVVDDDGQFVSQRTQPRLARVTTRFEGDSLVVGALDGPGRELRVPLVPPADLAASRGLRPVRIWSDTCDALDMGDEARAFFTEALGFPCSLVHMPDGTRRAVDPRYATAPHEIVGFADGYPFLIAGEASLDDVNGRLATPVPMNRFRPNIVVRGSSRFEEDGWRTLTVGAIAFSIVKPCARCVMITIDQETGVAAREPLATLATYRTRGNGVDFGQNAIAHGTGRIHVGDDVTITARAPS